MCSDVVISVRNLTKTYRIFGHPGDRIKQALTFGRVRFHREFTALKDVSFDIKRGETVGIIGRNGSGKSTLLQLICGILKPTSGAVHVRGRISALLELGSGFNPEFTGRENVYFQGAIMGFNKEEMSARFGDIAAFADIGDFIDQPVRTYSSGMFVRLAFAVAISIDPDVLVVDEALSVGDIGFQQKCLERIRKMQDLGVTIFLVSHDLMLMRNFADTLIYMDQGNLKKMGRPEAVGELYLHDTSCNLSPSRKADAHVAHSGGVTPKGIGDVAVFYDGTDVVILVTAYLAPDIAHPEIVVQLRDSRGYILYGRHAVDSDIVKFPSSGGLRESRVILAVGADHLAGDYGVSVSLNCLDAHGVPTVLDKQVGVATIKIPVLSDAGLHGCVNLNGRWLREHPLADDGQKRTVL